MLPMNIIQCTRSKHVRQARHENPSKDKEGGALNPWLQRQCSSAIMEEQTKHKPANNGRGDHS